MGALQPIHATQERTDVDIKALQKPSKRCYNPRAREWTMRRSLRTRGEESGGDEGNEALSGNQRQMDRFRIYQPWFSPRSIIVLLVMFAKRTGNYERLMGFASRWIPSVCQRCSSMQGSHVYF